MIESATAPTAQRRLTLGLLLACVCVMAMLATLAHRSVGSIDRDLLEGDVDKYYNYSNLMLGGPTRPYFRDWGDVGRLNGLLQRPILRSAGLVPYRDFAVEYPPGALLWMALPRLFFSQAEPYTLGFMFEMMLVNLGTLLLCLWMVRRLGLPRLPLLLGACFGFLALGPIALTRLDSALALLLVATLASALAGQPRSCGAMLACATATKLFPALLIPLFGLYWMRTQGFRGCLRFVVAFCVVCAIWFVPAWWVGGARFWLVFAFHGQRPIQIESTFGGLALLGGLLRGTPMTVFGSYGSINVKLSDSVANAMNWFSLVLLLSGVTAVAVLWKRAWNSFSEDESASGDFVSLVRAVAASCVAIMVTSKVFSPQYPAWILPWIFLVNDRPVQILTGVACFLTQLLFPYCYGDLLMGTPWALGLLLFRNALMVGVACTLVWPWMRRASQPYHGPRDELADPFPSWKMQACTAAFLALGTFVVYALTSCHSIGFGDSGETVAVGNILGVGHPPGYPLYVLLVHAAQWLIPFGGPALRTNLLSCLAAAATVAVMYGLTLSVSRSAVGALLAALVLAFSSTFWFYAHYAKVYAFSTLLMALCWMILVRFPQAPVWFTGVFGLGLAAHYQTLLVVVPAFAYLVLARRRVSLAPWVALGLTVGMFVSVLCLGARDETLRNAASLLLTLPLVASMVWAARAAKALPVLPTSWRSVLRALAALVPGLAIYLYVPLRASAHPAINWDNASDLSRFWHFVTMADFAGLHGLSNLPEAMKRVGIYFGTLMHQYGLALVLTVPGIAWLYRRQRTVFFATLFAVLLNILWVALFFKMPIDGYASIILEGFYLPSNLLVAIWIGVGGACVARRAGRAMPAVGWAVAPLLFILPLGLFLSHWHENDRAHDTFAEDYGYNVLTTAAPDAVVIASGGFRTFPLWYWQVVRHYRPDVTVIFLDALPQGWYRDELAPSLPPISVRPDERGLAGLGAAVIAGCLKVRPVYADWYASERIDPALAVYGLGKPVCDGVLCRYGVSKIDYRRVETLLNETYRLNNVFDGSVYKDDVTLTTLLTYTRALDTLGIHYAEANDNTRALEYWNKAVSAAPGKETHARALLAAYYIDRNEQDEARREINELRRIDPDNAALPTLWARLQSPTSTGVDEPPAPQGLGMPPSPRGPGMPPSPPAGAVPQSGAAAPSPNAATASPNAATASPNAATASPSAADEARRLNREGIAAVMQRPRDMARAMKLWHEAVELDPRFPEPHANLGNALLDTGDTRDALKEYGIAVRLNPTMRGLHYVRGVAYERSGDRADAIDEYRKEIVLGPDPRQPVTFRAATARLRVLSESGKAVRPWGR